MPDAPKFTPPAAGPDHKVLEKDVGTWDAEIVIRMPGAPPQESKGVAVNRLVADRMWLVSDFKNETTGFEGHGVFGYDPHKKKYVGTWVDPMRASLDPMEGTWDAATRTMTFTVFHSGPRGSSQWRETTQTLDDDTQVFRIFMGPPSVPVESEVMTVTYRRRR
jgi:hypothetical protein